MRELTAVRFGLTLAVSAALAAAALSGAEAQTVGPVQGPSQSLAESSAQGSAQRPPRLVSDQGWWPAPNTRAYGGASGGAWRGLVWPPMSGGAIDRLAIATGDGLHAPDGQSLLVGRYGAADGPLGRFADSAISRDWPGAVQFKTGAFGFDVSPHAGVGRSGDGGSQDAGAVLRFGRGLGQGGTARPSKWYLFASTDQQTLATGFTANQDAWKRVNLGRDPGATIEDNRAGLAWRDGPIEASVGYLFREIKPRDLDMLDAQTNRESLVAFRLSFHPGQR